MVKTSREENSQWLSDNLGRVFSLWNLNSPKFSLFPQFPHKNNFYSLSVFSYFLRVLACDDVLYPSQNPNVPILEKNEHKIQNLLKNNQCQILSKIVSKIAAFMSLVSLREVRGESSQEKILQCQWSTYANRNFQIYV